MQTGKQRFKAARLLLLLTTKFQTDCWERLPTNWTGGFFPMSSKAIEGFMASRCSMYQRKLEDSTHLLTEKVDEDYRLHRTQRHADLVVQLNQLSYKTTLHPAFTEFIVNTYGILKEKPDKHSNQAMAYNNPDFLRRLIMMTAPGKLQKDLLLLLTCLCYVAGEDKRPLILGWTCQL